MYFVGIKATLCSHIILRLRSYFNEDSIVYSTERTTLDGDDLSPTVGTTIQISTTRRDSRPPRQKLEWTDGPDPLRKKSVQRVRSDNGRNVWVATGNPNADVEDSERGRRSGRSTSWLRPSGTLEVGRSFVVMEDSSDRIPSDLEMDEFTPESSHHVRKGA